MNNEEKGFRTRLLNLAEIGGRAKILDLACGSGTMATLFKTRYSETLVTGLDGDPAILALARNKAADARCEVQFDEGLS